MKKVLFISHSKLSHNLFKAVLPLVPVKTDVVCVEGVGEIAKISKRGKKADLIVADWNVFSETTVSVVVAAIEKHPLLKGARRILIHSKEANPQGLEGRGFSLKAKPFLAEDLAGIIEKGVS